MPRTVNEVLQKVKKECDLDSFMYHFKGTERGEAYTRNVLYKPWIKIDEFTWNDNYSYYYKVIMPKFESDTSYNIYYKNDNGVWIDYRSCKKSHPTMAIKTSAVLYEDLFKIKREMLPSCVFMDDEYYIHYIDEHDGDDSDNEIPIIEIDASKEGVVDYRPFSIEDPTLLLTGEGNGRHLMEDLRVKATGFPSNRILTWLNGVFVPIIRDDTYEDTFYIKNGLSLVGTRCINQKASSTVSRKDQYTATMVEDEAFNEYRFDVRLRLFSWRGVKVSTWYEPLLTEKMPIVHNYTAVYITYKVTFPQVINKNAHMIFENGILLDKDQYTIDGQDGRKIELKNVSHQAYMLLAELIRDMSNPENIQYYANIKPLSLMEVMLTHKTYTLVNFSSDEEVDGKKLYLKRSKSLITDFPYKNEITFTNLRLGDLVTINGTFNEYEWIHNHTISLPRFVNTFRGSEGGIKEDDVRRLYFIVK
jgi:hypothetical protein